MKPEYNKVTAYITCAGKLVVFTQTDFPRAGVQVPSGTVDDGEDLEKTVLREAYEETGLLNLKVETFLVDKKQIFYPPDDDPVQIHRHYYHLSYPGPIDQERWQH
jgi:8-oxo-dGTP pyrophosphatase MutT (NUDIX family)